jgi:hypothetical protein
MPCYWYSFFEGADRRKCVARPHLCTCRKVSWLERHPKPNASPMPCSLVLASQSIAEHQITTLPHKHRHHASTTTRPVSTTTTTTTTGALAAAAYSALVPNGGWGAEGIVCGVFLFSACRLAIRALGLPAINATQDGLRFTHLLVALLYLLGSCTKAKITTLHPSHDTSSNTSPAAFSVPSRPAASAFQTLTDNSMA